jgi:hypothetical protein
MDPRFALMALAAAFFIAEGIAAFTTVKQIDTDRAVSSASHYSSPSMPHHQQKKAG